VTREQALQVLIDAMVAAVVEEILREEMAETTPDSDNEQRREAA